jgi:hypothetical protein
MAGELRWRNAPQEISEEAGVSNGDLEEFPEELRTFSRSRRIMF